MKRLLFIVCLLCSFSITINAQENQPVHRVYCELLGTGKMFSTKVTVQIDFGQEKKFFNNNTVVDDNGKPINFNSMVDAMNFMGERGWKFEQAYVVTIAGGMGGTQNVYHWLLSKDIVGDDIQAGLLTKTQYNKFQKQ